MQDMFRVKSRKQSRTLAQQNEPVPSNASPADAKKTNQHRYGDGDVKEGAECASTA